MATAEVRRRATAATRVKRSVSAWVELPVQSGTAGDHPAIFQLLHQAEQGVSAGEFQARLDAPDYLPSQRLLVRQNGRLAGHVQANGARRHWGEGTAYCGEVSQLVVRPEFRARGVGRSLVMAGDRALLHGCMPLALAASDQGEFLMRRGWRLLPAGQLSAARAVDVLSVLREGAVDTDRALTVRPWRHVELPPLERLYAAATAGMFGPLARSETYWRWLISRRGWTNIYVAVEGPDNFDLGASEASIVGYAVVRGAHIVELVTLPGDHAVGRSLIERVCHDAVERNEQRVALEGVASAPWHALFDAASHMSPHSGGHKSLAIAAHMLDANTWLQGLTPLMHARARAAAVTRPCELSLEANHFFGTLQLGPRAAKWSPRERTRLRLCDGGESAWLDLLCGSRSAEDLLASRELKATTRAAAELAKVLFPRHELWLPRWDHLPAIEAR